MRNLADRKNTPLCWLVISAVLFVGCARTFPAREVGREKQDFNRKTTGQVSTITAREIVQRIKEHANCRWQDKTVDTFKCGDPNAPVSGIAVTFAATLDVLKRAHSAGLNFIITHEPTFYHGYDDTSQLEKDEVLEAKRRFIKDNKLVIWRFHDHWHAIEPDGIVTGMVERLLWQQNLCRNEKLVFEFPETTVREFAATLKRKLNDETIRVVGNPEMKFRRVGLLVGAHDSIVQMRMLERGDVDVLVTGETREWETVEYARDAATTGRRKALILLGHANSEEAGMDYCARWLREFVPEIPVKFIQAGSPFWAP